SYIVSHNLRSHTSNILGLCDLVTRSYTDNEQRKYIRLLKNVANKLNHTIEGLSQVTHIQMAHTVSREQVYLKDCIDNTCRTVIDVHYGSKEFLFRNNVPGAVTVLFNRLYLENVLRILVSNAIKYRHPRRQLKIQLDFVHNDDERALIITDNGIGIDLEKDQGRLFGLFKTVSLNNASRGIGLYIARNQVEAMGGRIDVKSTPGKGASFKICFLK
ncbi:MAG TPA: HAMP domain-containing sensor histidine kinase, partial [Niabella sp.]